MKIIICILCCIYVTNGSEFKYFLKYAENNDKTCLSLDTTFTDDKATSLAKCSGTCSLDSSCRSLFFNGDTDFCYGCSRSYGDPTGLPSSPGSEYYVRPSKYNESCTDDIECVSGQYQVCFNNTCTCKPGYPLDPATNSCTTDCMEYGNTFQIYGFFWLNILDRYSWPGQLLPDPCKTHCASQTWCRGFDHSILTWTCHFKSETAATNPDALEYNGIYFHYSRNCALLAN